MHYVCTAFCKQLAESADYSDEESHNILVGSDDDDRDDKKEAAFSGKHPFMVRDKPIMMNIRNAPMLPVKSNAERLLEGSKLREQFPVSSGSHHRLKDNEWVPVEPGQKAIMEKPKQDDTDPDEQTPVPKEDRVFPDVDEVLFPAAPRSEICVHEPDDNWLLNFPTHFQAAHYQI